MPKYEIILPIYGRADLVEDCLKSIYKYSDDFIVIVVDNLPLNDYQDFRTLHYLMPHNIGFTNAVNIGLSISTAPYLVIMNSDTEVVTEGWLDKLSEMITPNVGIVGPATDRTSQWQGKPHPKGLVTPHRIEHSFGFDTKLTFFCTMISREAFLSVGYLDPNLPHGLGADDDWLWRAHLKGWRLAFQPDVTVNHVGAASFNKEDRDRWQGEAVEYLKRKYSLKYYEGDR